MINLSLDQLVDFTRYFYALYTLIVSAEQIVSLRLWAGPWRIDKRWAAIIYSCQISFAIFLALSTHWTVPVALLALASLQAIWWRGTYNGGSDMMSFTVLLGLTIYYLPLDSEGLKKMAMAYVGVQSFLSYFIAGVIKIKEPIWRNGTALKAFLISGIYSPLKNLENPTVGLLLAWMVMIFELSFPLIFIIDGFVFLLIGLALIFHLINAWIFGLNRFTFAWAASWPALIYITSLL